MRKVGIVLGVALLVLIVGVAVFIATFDVNRYRGTIQSQLEQRLVRKVTLGEMHLKLFPPRFSVQNLAIADDPAFNTEKPFIEAQQLDVAVQLAPLFKGNVEIDSLELERPSVELIKSAQGQWNFSSIGGAAEAPQTATRPPATPSAPSETAGRSTRQFSLAKLMISDGQVAVTDLQAKKPKVAYDGIDASLVNFALGAPFSFDVVAHLPGQGAQEMRFQGQAGPLAMERLATLPFEGVLDLKQVEIANLRRFTDSRAVARADGVVSGQARINCESGVLEAAGKMNVQNPRMDGRPLGYPITADYDIKTDLGSDVTTIQNMILLLGSTPIQVSGTVDSKFTPSQVNLRLKADNISITEAIQLAAASGVALAPGTALTGKLSATIQARGASGSPALSGSISGRDVEIRSKDLRQPVKTQSVNLSFTPNEIRSDTFNLTTGGTTLAAQFTVHDYRAKSPLVDASLRAPNATLPEVLSLAKAYGITSLNALSGEGTLNMDLRAAGPLEVLKSADVVRALNGTLALNCHSMRYAGVDVGYKLASIGGFLKSAQKDQGFTNITRMTGDIVVKNGVGQTNNLLAQLDIGNIGATGTADLASQLLNVRMTAVLSKEFSQRVGGAGIAGYLNTALANNQGELVIPAVVTGTFQNPKFAPDLQKVAQMKLKGLVPNSSDPLEAAAGILGGLLGKKKPDQTQKQEQQQPDAVQQLIDILGGKKKQQKPPEPPQPPPQ